MTVSRREAINARLHQLAKENGRSLTADVVIADARDPESPFHDSFEWDVERAAHQYWVTVANRLINGYRVEVTVENRTLHAPVYVRSPEQPKRYIHVDQMAGEHELAVAALRREGERVIAAIGRMQALAATLGLSSRIDAVDAAMRSMFEAIP